MPDLGFKMQNIHLCLQDLCWSSLRNLFPWRRNCSWYFCIKRLHWCKCDKVVWQKDEHFLLIDAVELWLTFKTKCIYRIRFLTWFLPRRQINAVNSKLIHLPIVGECSMKAGRPSSCAVVRFPTHSFNVRIKCEWSWKCKNNRSETKRQMDLNKNSFESGNIKTETKKNPKIKF